MIATRSTNPREERRQLHQELSRTQLLDAAEQIFGQKGFHETTLKEIAERADFSVGSVYSFFANKDDLYGSVWLRRGAEFIPGFESAVAEAEGGVAALRAIVEFEVSFLRARPAFADLYLRTTGSLVPTLNEGTSERITENADLVLEMQAAVIARGQAEGVIRRGDPAALSRLLSSMVQAFHSVDFRLNAKDSEALPLEQFQEIIYSAFCRL